MQFNAICNATRVYSISISFMRYSSTVSIYIYSALRSEAMSYHAMLCLHSSRSSIDICTIRYHYSMSCDYDSHTQKDMCFVNNYLFVLSHPKDIDQSYPTTNTYSYNSCYSYTSYAAHDCILCFASACLHPMLCFRRISVGNRFHVSSP